MNLIKLNFVPSVLNPKNTYRLLIGLLLLLFTQVVIPNLHHHNEEYAKQGINISIDEACVICSLHIVSADFIVPTLFSFLLLSSVCVSSKNYLKSILLIFSPFIQGRGPPILHA